MRASRVLPLLIAPTLLVGCLLGPAAASVQVASGPDFNGDGFADLAIAAPTEDQSGNGAVVVNVLYGATGVLSSAGNQLWSQDSEGLPDRTEAFDAFGQALAW